ncbi:MAG TPA: RagB/SusD family nutrient uptake outer membrane protein, partial [Pedobacter sp.]|nr:RagB/SusD family nutrient uptake outer membrane protein [Pedobacter sp.]
IHHYVTYEIWTPFIFYQGQGVTPEHVYELYDVDDLRKSLFFWDLPDGRHSFKGTYEGNGIPFSGIATDEIYLIRAECNARLGNIDDSMKDINTLLVNRYATGTHVDVSAATSEDALNIVLLERRKELLFRGQRWNDLKRFNRDGMNIEIVRTINGVHYKLLPNDIRYVMPIPKYVIDASDLKTNNR